jgi:hypothetical protein
LFIDVSVCFESSDVLRQVCSFSVLKNVLDQANKISMDDNNDYSYTEPAEETGPKNLIPIPLHHNIPGIIKIMTWQ